MIKIRRPEKSIITGKPIEKKDILCNKEFITYHVGELTKITTDTDFPGDDVLINFFDSKGRTFVVSQRSYIPLYMATCLIHIDRDDVVPADFQEKKSQYFGYPTMLCSDPRVVWIALVHIWLNFATPESLRGDDKILSQMLTDLLPTHEEAVEKLEKNLYPPFVSCYSDIKYAAKKYRGQDLGERRHFDYRSYPGNWLIEPPTVDWSKYGG